MTRKYPSAWDLNLELEDIDKEFSAKLLRLGPVREVDNIRRASGASKKAFHRSIGPTRAPKFQADFCFFAPVIRRPNLPESGLVQTEQKHFGILSSTIYKERQPGKSLERARYIEANGVHEGLTQTDPTTIRIAKYVEGVDSPDNDRVVHCQSNVGETFDDRIAFWSAFDREAVFRGDAKVAIDIRGKETEWAELAQGPMQGDVRKAYEAALQSDGTAELIVNSAEQAKRYSMAEAHRTLFDKTLKVSCHGNQVTMMSVTLPLPYELSWKAKLMLAGTYCRHFGDRGLPYQAVIHAPEKTNDSRNWHMHINYVPFAVDKDPDTGKWSFEREEYKCTKSRKTRTRQIKKLTRHPDTKAENGWVEGLKKAFCDAANAQLISEGHEARFTTKTNAELKRGEAEQRMGPKVAALQKQGIRTPQSVDAARSSWATDAKREADAKALIVVSALRHVFGLKHKPPENPYEQSLSEIGKLRRISALAEWKAREIVSGRQFVEAEQRKIISSPKSSDAKIAMAKALIAACLQRKVEEEALLLRLRNIGAIAKAAKKQLKREFVASHYETLRLAEIAKRIHRPAADIGKMLARRRNAEAAMNVGPHAPAVSPSPQKPTVGAQSAPRNSVAMANQTNAQGFGL